MGLYILSVSVSVALIMFSADSRGNDGGAAVMQDCAGGALLCLCGRRYQ